LRLNGLTRRRAIEFLKRSHPQKLNTAYSAWAEQASRRLAA
jgi:hypothetical protein